MVSNDTHPDIEQMQIELLRRMPVARKLELIAQMNQSMRTMAISGLRRHHPDEDEAQLRRRLADLVLGAELAARVYGPPQYVPSPEDTILGKLQSYQARGEMSQWRWCDVIEDLRVQGNRLDRAYMSEMAATLGVVDLLDRALHEAA